MALLYPTTGLADPIKFGNSLLAIDVAASTVLGMGVITGLLVGSGGVVAVGDALIGHVVTLGTAFSTAPLLAANATNYVYFQMPPSPICERGRMAACAVFFARRAVTLADASRSLRWRPCTRFPCILRRTRPPSSGRYRSWKVRSPTTKGMRRAR